MIELIGRKHDLLQDKRLAHHFMLTQETKKLHENKERVNFFTNQVMSELRRVGEDNGDALIEHFMSKATVQVEYINQQKDMWGDFLEFFGSGDPDMFNTDDEFEEPAPPVDQPTEQEQMPPLEEPVQMQRAKTYAPSKDPEQQTQPQPQSAYKRQESSPLTLSSQPAPQ